MASDSKADDGKKLKRKKYEKTLRKLQAALKGRRFVPERY
jgi:hypothetical protein